MIAMLRMHKLAAGSPTDGPTASAHIVVETVVVEDPQTYTDLKSRVRALIEREFDDRARGWSVRRSAARLPLPGPPSERLLIEMAVACVPVCALVRVKI